jgi:hypothetical protein
MPMTTSKSGGIAGVVKYIDLFGVEPRINIQQKAKYNTVLGGVISIFIYITIILGFVYFGQELVVKRNPTVIVSNQYDVEPQRFNLTKDKFNFVLQIQDGNSYAYVDYSIFTVKVRCKTTTRTVDANGEPSYTYNTLYPRLEICNMARHFPNFVEQFAGQELSNSMCIHPDDSDSLSIQGVWGSAKYTAVIMDIYPCTNGTTPGIVCKPQDEIDKKLSGGFLSVNVIDTIFDPVKFEKPYQYIGRADFFTSLSKNFFKLYTLYFKNIDYETDVADPRQENRTLPSS